MSEVMRFIHGGGFMMYPLLLCSVVLIAVAIERAISLRKAAVDGDTLLDEVKTAYKPDKDADPTGAIALSMQAGGPVGRMFARGLKNAHRSADAIEMAMEQEAANEQPALEANLPVLRTIVNISPLLGLLGTIAGMITSFRAASQVGLSNPTQILGGIAEALISTATGISLAVIGFICYNYFANLSKKIIEDMEYYGSELVNYLTGRVD
ncbi:MAG TPA: MotA/TolQ/ExbB proton channel family protein [Chthonomonadaceae bacterium]|nr:MotA/TolQ/ExbB proton channel family protein [Chthonomonadaceae bacterium]